MSKSCCHVPAAMALVVLLSEAGAATFTVIPDLPGARINGSGNGVSSDGTIVVGKGEERIGANDVTAGFVWKADTGSVRLPFASTTNTTTDIKGISGNGQVIFGQARNDFNESQATLWTRQSNGTYTPALIEPPDEILQSFDASHSSVFNASSTDGTAFAGSGRADPFTVSGASPSTFLGFIYRPGNAKPFTIIPDLPGGRTTSFAVGISGNGTKAVGISSSANRSSGSGTNNEAISFTLPNGPTIGLGDLRPDKSEFSSDANAISKDGTTIVGRGRLATGGNPAFRYTVAGGMVSLGTLPNGVSPITSQARAVNADGSVVIGDASTTTNTEAFVWTAASGMRKLSAVANLTSDQLKGGYLENANAISDDGKTIVGTLYMVNPANANLPFREAFVLTLTQQELFPTNPPAVTQAQLEALANLRASNANGILRLEFTTNPSLQVSYTLQYSPDLATAFADRLAFTTANGIVIRGTPVLGYQGTADSSTSSPVFAENFSLSALPSKGFYRLKVSAQP